MRKTKVTTRLLFLVLAVISVACLCDAIKPGMSDLGSLREALRGHTSTDSSAYMDKAWVVVRSGLPLFPTLFFERHVKYIYPTSSLLLSCAAGGMGVTLFALIRVVVLVSALLTLMLGGEIFLAVLPEQAADKGYRWKVRVLVALLGVFFYPLINGVQLGQIQTLLTFLFTLAVWLWMRGYKASAAVCLALACSFKPPLALFLIWGALRQEWKFVGTLVGVALLLQGVAIAVFGWRNEVEYLSVLSYLSRHGEFSGENQSVNGLLQRLLRNGMNDPVTDYVSYPPYNSVVYVGTVLSSLLFVAVGLVVPMWRRWQGSVADFVWFGLLSTIASPIVWTHHYGVFYVGSVFFLAMSLKHTGTIPVAFVLCFVALANFFHLLGRFYRVPTVNWVFSYGLYAGLGIIFLIAYQYEKRMTNNQSHVTGSKLGISASELLP